MKLSLCMIVKNEEKYLSKCLNSIRNYIDEIIIVDTGSTDNTKEIASQYTDKVYFFEWCDDFAAARNFSLSKASNNWVLILDADEFVAKFNKKEITKFINSNPNAIGRLKRINPFENGNEVKKYIERVNRLFNKKYFHYKGIIHEQIVPRNEMKYEIKPIKIEVDHIGYLDEVIINTKKLQRNIKLLKESIEIEPNDPYLYYQLGKSYYRNKDYKGACINFENAIDLCTDFKYEYTEDLIESYGYALLKCEQYEQALNLKKYQYYYENSPDYNFIMGLIYMNNGKFKDSINYFKKCIGEKPGRIEGINSYQPNYNIGVIYETLELYKQSLEYYQNCGEYTLAKERIKEIIEKQELSEKKDLSNQNYEEIKNEIKKNIEISNLQYAKKLLNELFNSYNNDVELYSMKSVIEMIENRLDESEKTLQKALKIESKNFDILYNLGYLYEIQNKNKLALRTYEKTLYCVDSAEMKSQIKEKITDIKSKLHKTSIIILTYNNLDYNKICIESIRKYTKKDIYEIIVVDNNSTDGTVKWLKTQKDLKVIYNMKNFGFPKGCNQGIEIATGDEILLLNNDTIVTPRWLENLRECLYSSEDIGAVGPVTNSCPNYQTIPTNYDNVEDMIKFANEYNKSDSDSWEEKLRLVGYCMLIKKEVIDKVGILDERFTPGNFEDDDFSFRMRKQDYRLMLCRDTFIHHFGSTSFKENNNEFLKLLKKNRLKFQEKWGVDPHDIIDIEKDIADLIIDRAKSNMSVMHVGCKGGATLLRIKNKDLSLNLYGIEINRDIVINAESFSRIENDDLFAIEKYFDERFDFIILSISKNNKNDIISKIEYLQNHLMDNGILYMNYTEKIKDLDTNLDKILRDKIEGYYLKTIRVNNQQILSMRKQHFEQQKNKSKITIYKQEDLCKFEDYKPQNIASILRRLDNKVNFEKNISILRGIVDEQGLDAEIVKDYVLKVCIDKIKSLNVLGILYYQNNEVDQALVLLYEAINLDRKNKDTIYNIAYILHEVGENNLALEFLEGIEVEYDSEINYLKGKIGETLS